MSRRTAVAAALTALVLTAPACRSGRTAGTGAAAAVPFIAVDAAGQSPTDRAVAAAQARLEQAPDDPRASVDLARAFLQKSREVADPSLYTKAAGLLKQAAKVMPDDPALLSAEGSLANAQHRFADALAIGRRAVAASPDSESAYAVVVDAANELGQYDEALDATQRMADLRSDLPALSRASYARELHGDLAGATVAMTQAVTAGGRAGGENVAYVQSLLGDLLLTQGHAADAKAMYEAALQSFPGLAAPRAGLAKVLVAEGRYADAAAGLHDLVQSVPLAEYAIAEGDDWAAAGDPSRAADAYALVGTISRLYAANGVNVDLELALFDADHHPTSATVAQARRGLKARSSYFGHEVLAWTLYRTGKVKDATREIRSALTLGDRDPLLRFHAAVIFDAAGDRSDALENISMVVGSNPRFSAAHVADVAQLAARYGLHLPATTQALGQ